MEHRLRRLALTVLAVLGLVVAGAHSAAAQPAGTLADRVEQLEKKLAALEKEAVAVPTMAAAVEELTEKLALVQQELATLRREQKSIPDTIDVVDDLTLRVQALEREAEGLRTRIADVEQPGADAAGGGGIRYDGGVILETSDGRFGVRLNAYAQARYHVLFSDGDLEEDTFSIRRARIGLSGNLGGDRLTWKLLFDTVDSPVARDVVIGYRFFDWLQLQAGQYKTQYTRNYISSSWRLMFPDRTLPLDVLRYGRDIGVGVAGEVLDGRLRYFAGVENGGGSGMLNDNLDVKVTGRIDAAVLGAWIPYGYADLQRSGEPRLSVGGGVVHDLRRVPDTVSVAGGDPIDVNVDVDGDGHDDNVRVVSASADAIFRYRGLEVAVEGYLRHERWGTIVAGNPDLAAASGSSAEDRTYLGIQGQAGYFVWRQLLVAGRFAAGEVPFLGVGGRSSSILTGDTVYEADGLVQLYHGHAWRWIGLMYSYFDFGGTGGAPDKEHRLLLEGQIRL